MQRRVHGVDDADFEATPRSLAVVRTTRTI
jgi:hypothetical protein